MPSRGTTTSGMITGQSAVDSGGGQGVNMGKPWDFVTTPPPPAALLLLGVDAYEATSLRTTLSSVYLQGRVCNCE